MGCDGEKEGLETLNVSEIVSYNCLGRIMWFYRLARFSAHLYPHLTKLSDGGEVAYISKRLLGPCV